MQDSTLFVQEFCALALLPDPFKLAAETKASAKRKYDAEDNNVSPKRAKQMVEAMVAAALDAYKQKQERADSVKDESSDADVSSEEEAGGDDDKGRIYNLLSALRSSY